MHILNIIQKLRLNQSNLDFYCNTHLNTCVSKRKQTCEKPKYLIHVCDLATVVPSLETEL